MKSKTSCYTYFSIRGDFEPDEISQKLNLQPFRTFKKGEPRPKGNSRYECSFWGFGKCDKYDGIVENQMLITIAPLFDKIDILNDLKKRYDLYFYLEVVPTINSKESTPSLSPSLEVMRFCCDTGTNIDIDYYIF